MNVFFIVFGIILIAACIIHWFAANCVDLEDFLIDEHGWVTIIVVIAVGAVVAGFVFWIWWVMLIILGCLAVIGGIAGLIIRRANDYGGYYDGDDEEVVSQKTKYKCDNCGAKLVKFTVKKGFDDKTEYKCEYCGVSYTAKELLGVKMGADWMKEKGFDEMTLTDFEEEYFEACERFMFRPYNEHTQNEIERRYDKLNAKIDRYEDVYEDVNEWDQREVLEEANDFLTESEKEIKEYFAKHTTENIKKRYEFYSYMKKADEAETEKIS